MLWGRLVFRERMNSNGMTTAVTNLHQARIELLTATLQQPIYRQWWQQPPQEDD
jgi:hypothetical protein